MRTFLLARGPAKPLHVRSNCFLRCFTSYYFLKCNHLPGPGSPYLIPLPSLCSCFLQRNIVRISNVCKHSQALDGKRCLQYLHNILEKRVFVSCNLAESLHYINDKTVKKESPGTLIISLCYKYEAYLSQNRFSGPESAKKPDIQAIVTKYMT